MVESIRLLNSGRTVSTHIPNERSFLISAAAFPKHHLGKFTVTQIIQTSPDSEDLGDLLLVNRLLEEATLPEVEGLRTVSF